MAKGDVRHNGRWIIFDTGTHKVFGIPTEFTQPVPSALSLSETQDWVKSREAEDRSFSGLRRDANRCAQSDT